MKAIRWLLKLILVIMTLPLILTVWLIKWFVVFLHHCSAWIFYLLAQMGIECEPIRLDSYTKKKMTFFFDPDGLPLELHE